MIYAVIKSQSADVSRLCKSAGVSRSGYYRYLNRKPKSDPDIEIRDRIQRICLESSSYGYRYVTKALHRQGYRVNHKRVLRLMREDNLLCVHKKRFVVTTDSNHSHRRYPNLATQMTLNGINQLWVSDITYIRLTHRFVYLAVILDSYSRRVIGWRLDKHLDTSLTIGALKMALHKRTITPGLVHHSDRGVQYAASDYTDLLKQHGIQISMSRKGNPYDNARCERFMRTLKYEEVLVKQYHDLDEARANIKTFIEQVYNQKRLHSALGYCPPAEFEELLPSTHTKNKFVCVPA